MILEVDTASAVPAYEQVRSQIAAMIASGALPAGTRLPPIRRLAADLDLAPGTVARVYRELEAHGMVTSRVRHGTVVAERATVPRAVLADQLADAARAYALAASRLGVPLDEARAALGREWVGPVGP